MRRAWLGAGAVVLALAACSSPDTTAVPTTAAEPYVCAGVPQRGVDLTLGGTASAEEQGSWQGDGPAFSCSATRSGSKVLVTYGDPSTFLSLDEAGQQEGATAVSADADGSGYAFGDSKPTAMWVCGDHVLAVELVDVDTSGRHPLEDAQNLLVSMLPWACGSEPVPS